MWSDNESLSDYIDFSHLVSAVSGIINNDDLLPCSIGVYGDWGSGKSSLMRMLESQFEGGEDTLVIKFNGWLFEGYEDAKTVLMARIVDEIISKRTFTEKAKKYAAKLLKRIDWIKIAGTSAKYGVGFLTMGPVGVAGLGVHDTLSKLKDVDYAKYIQDKQEKKDGTDETLRSNIQEFHKNFEDLIDETKIKKIIVFIDDLDRCSPDTIIGTLEAIKLFLFTKKTAFVVGADERLIKYAVRRRFPEVPGENMEVGRDYLEKLIQYPIRIPPLNAIELTTYINLLFCKLYNEPILFEEGRSQVIEHKRKSGFNFVFDQSNISQFFKETNSEFEDAITLSSQIVPVLSVGLNGNPRQVKRFLNTLLVRMNMATAKHIALKRRTLAKLMLLEYFKPETFTSFHDIQAENQGRIPVINKIEAAFANGSKEEEIKKDLTASEKLLLEDNWITDWIKSEPNIGQDDLQAYFYFSRDKLTITAVNLQRMTPKAQDVIQKLLHSSQATRTNGFKLIKNLSSSEAASIFEALTQKIRQEENINGDAPAFRGIFELSKEKSELKSQLTAFLLNYPEGQLPVTSVTLAESVLKDSDTTVLRDLLKKWASSNNSRLAAVAKRKLK